MKIHSRSCEQWKNSLVYFSLSGLYFKCGHYSVFQHLNLPRRALSSLFIRKLFLSVSISIFEYHWIALFLLCESVDSVSFHLVDDRAMILIRFVDRPPIGTVLRSAGLGRSYPDLLTWSKFGVKLKYKTDLIFKFLCQAPYLSGDPAAGCLTSKFDILNCSGWNPSTLILQSPVFYSWYILIS